MDEVENMLIVKGETQKSVLANILLKETNSICFQYYNTPVIFNSICLDSTEYSLEDFIECIAEESKRVNADRTHYDYLIVYTNEKEEDLKILIDWLREHMWRFFCKDIMVMCKE